MNNRRKIKAQLIQELNELRDRFESELGSTTESLCGYVPDELIGMSCLKFSAEIEKTKTTLEKTHNSMRAHVPVRLHQKNMTGLFSLLKSNASRFHLRKKSMVCNDQGY